MGWLVLLLVLGGVAWGVNAWWQWSTVLPQGYTTRTENAGWSYEMVELIGPDGETITGSYHGLFMGYAGALRKVTRAANAHSRAVPRD